MTNRSPAKVRTREWNATDVDFRADVCLHQLFEAQTVKTPDGMAVGFEGSALTYRELNLRANRLAHYLRDAGVGPDTLVGVFMDRSIEMVVGLYGILKAGGAYVPLDPEYPSARIAHMLDDTAVPIVLTRRHLRGMLPSAGRAEALCLDSEQDLFAGCSADNPISVATPRNLAYVIYTSGSTGRPKGVMNEHRGIVNRLLWMQAEYGLSESDRVLQKTPFSFDVSVWEFFWPLLCGAGLVIARPGGHRDTGYLVDTITGEGITTLHFVPSMLRAFLTDERAAQCRGLKRVFCSGEQLPYSLQRDFFDKMGPAELHNLYGPTEAAVDVTYWRCQRDCESKVVPIGRPVANTRIYILDEQMRMQPAGVLGELHIGGVQVARGYLNQPGLTAERFIPDPFSDRPGEKLYKTGDICRYLGDGSIEYCGRNDFQIKIRGHRIEAGEIESVLDQHPAVAQSLVTAREDSPGDKVLVGYVIPSGDQTLSAHMLRSHLRERLPEFMVPAAFVMLDRFPVTPNGKTDRGALPAPDSHRHEPESTYVPPRTATERVIAAIWQEVLRVEATGVDDSFFDLGGDSLRMTRVHSLLREKLGKELTLLEMFRYPTIGSLAWYVSGGRDEADAPKSDGGGERLKQGRNRIKRRLRNREQTG